MGEKPFANTLLRLEEKKNDIRDGGRLPALSSIISHSSRVKQKQQTASSVGGLNAQEAEILTRLLLNQQMWDGKKLGKPMTRGRTRMRSSRTEVSATKAPASEMSTRQSDRIPMGRGMAVTTESSVPVHAVQGTEIKITFNPNCIEISFCGSTKMSNSMTGSTQPNTKAGAMRFPLLFL